MSRATAKARGFTLLEVMVAMAILAVSLVALSEINAGAIAMHTYAKKLSVATQLAKAKMLDIETELDEKGLPAEGDNLSPSDGNFEEQGFAEYKWKVEVVAPKTENLDATKLVNMLVGGGDGSSDGTGAGGGLKPVDPSAGGMGLLGMLSGGGSPGDSSKGGPQVGTSPMAGMAAGMLAAPAQQMITQITQMVREVRLTVSWMDGKVPQEFTVVEHYVSMGPSGPKAVQGSTTQANPLNPTDR